MHYIFLKFTIVFYFFSHDTPEVPIGSHKKNKTYGSFMLNKTLGGWLYLNVKYCSTWTDLMLIILFLKLSKLLEIYWPKMLKFQIFKMSIAESSRNLTGLLQIATLFNKKSCLRSFWSQSRRPTTVYHNIPRKFLSKCPIEQNLSKAN
jgi:hypothetical protein